MTCASIRAVLGDYLTGDLPPERAAGIRDHLDACEPCWQRWNRLRWDAAAGTPLYGELTEYLGEAFLPYLDSSRLLAAAWDRADPHTTDAIHRFYRSTDAYLYNQVIWHASGNRPRYVDAALPLLADHPGATILDYGCGIGEDVLALHRAGFHVIACDLASPPTDFLTWRAPRHGYPHPVYQPHQLTTAPPHTILWIMDALDHIQDLDTDLSELLPAADLLICENLTASRAHGRQRFHRRRPLPEIEAVFHRYGLTREPAGTASNALTVWRRPQTRTSLANPNASRSKIANVLPA